MLAKAFKSIILLFTDLHDCIHFWQNSLETLINQLLSVQQFKNYQNIGKFLILIKQIKIIQTYKITKLNLFNALRDT